MLKTRQHIITIRAPVGAKKKTIRKLRHALLICFGYFSMDKLSKPGSPPTTQPSCNMSPLLHSTTDSMQLPPSLRCTWLEHQTLIKSLAWNLDSVTGMESGTVYTSNPTPNISSHHHYHYQWWDFVTGIFPPYSLLTNSHHGGFLSWWEFAG